MKKNRLTTLALSTSIRKPMPRPTVAFKVKKREARNAWRKAMAD